jgi:hypothetical protein
VTLPNDPSRALHRSLGYVPAGLVERAGWKFGRWYAVEFWTRPIGPDDPNGRPAADPRADPDADPRADPRADPDTVPDPGPGARGRPAGPRGVDPVLRKDRSQPA